MSLAEISHPIFERVRVIHEGRSKRYPSKDLVIFIATDDDDLHRAFELEGERRNGLSHSEGPFGPRGERYLLGFMAPQEERNVDVAEPFREFLNSMSREVGR